MNILQYKAFFSIGLWLILASVSLGIAQDTLQVKKKKKRLEENLTLEGDSLFKLELTDKKEKDIRFDEVGETKARRKSEKKRKKVYFGIKTKSGILRTTAGDEVVSEYFRIISPDYLIKNPYQREVYFYEVKNRRIRVENYNDFLARRKKGQLVYLLHGHYQKIREREVREEGYFYKGLKHSKWQEFDKAGILLEKLKYNLGLTEETKVSYYDEAETKVKEIIPYAHGRKQGKYARYYENGVLAQEGSYDNNEKVSLWREWYENRQRKQDIQYATKWWEPKEPTKLREWEASGKPIFDIDRGGKLKN
jgi:antitoxin component YwqK of YwqJK toxin-antitoxin module